MRTRLVPSIFGVVAVLSGSTAFAGVYRCSDASGKTLYSNVPCETQGTKTAKAFRKEELRPNSVKMPKQPPPGPAPGGEPGGLIGALKQKPFDASEMIREGDPDKHPKGGIRHPLLEKLTGGK